MTSDIEKSVSELSESFNGKEINILVVSGTQYRGFIQNGIDKLLPDNIKLVYGPGCVLCSLENGFIDLLVDISHREKVILTISPELLQARGSKSSLEEERKAGFDIRVMYTFQDILLLAKHKRRHKIVFPAIGFDTTAANTAAAVLQAKVAGLFNFTVLSRHRNLLETVMARLKIQNNIDAVIFSPQDIAVRGTKEFAALSEEKKINITVCGTEKSDLLQGLYATIQNIADKKNSFWQQDKYELYSNGIEKSKLLINEVFSIEDIFYPGIGIIPAGGYNLNDTYTLHNAEKRLNLNKINVSNTVKTECICNEIIKGSKTPENCIFYKKQCNPLNPLGFCMASKEGLCNIEFLY